MNNVTLIGNLATDVEVRDVGDDKKVANFLLAVDRPTADSDADFVRITAWNRQAEVCAEFLSKGRRVAVEGRLQEQLLGGRGREEAQRDRGGREVGRVPLGAESGGGGRRRPVRGGRRMSGSAPS